MVLIDGADLVPGDVTVRVLYVSITPATAPWRPLRPGLFGKVGIFL